MMQDCKVMLGMASGRRLLDVLFWFLGGFELFFLLPGQCSIL
jgi:hypothetical protein